MSEAMIGRNRRGGFKRRASSTFSLEPAEILAMSPWSWAWSGVGGEHVTTADAGGGKLRITQLDDISGNGRHYTRFNPANLDYTPYYEAGVVINDIMTYSTALAPIGQHRLLDDTQVFGQGLEQAVPMNAAGVFYLAAACLNYRDAGTRFLWGTSLATATIRLDQENNRLVLNKDGGGNVIISASGTVPSPAFVVIEIWRDGSNVIQVMVNGSDVGAGLSATGTWAMSGWGGATEIDGGSSAGWDDWLFELIAFNSLPSVSDRTFIRNYLTTKWASDT